MKKLFFLFILFLTSPGFAAAATILYQNCTPGSSCTGAGSNNGWTRTVETTGCHSGECLKLIGTLNTNPDAVGYGAGNTSLAKARGIEGKSEITIQSWMKFSKYGISGSNMKNFIAYIGDGTTRFPTVITPHTSGDFYLNHVNGTFTSPSWFEVTTSDVNYAYSTDNYDGTYTTTKGYTKGNIEGGRQNVGPIWVQVTVYLKMPTTLGGSNGVVKIWLNGELMIDYWNVSCGTTNGTAFNYLTFYSSSEAEESFEHWMDDMIIYEGYVPPSAVDTDPSLYPVTLTTSGTGSGTITTDPTSTDGRYLEDSYVRLTFTPDSGSLLTSVTGCVLVDNHCDLLVSSNGETVNAVFTLNTGAPYIYSDYMSVSFNLNSFKNYASGSDNWPVTEDSAGVQWTTWGDGFGFQGTTRASIGVAKIVGSKDSYSGTDTWQSGDGYIGWAGKSKGVLAVGDVENGGKLYLWRSGTGSDVLGYELEQLYKSTDGGLTFVEVGGAAPVKWIPSEFSPTSPRFANCTFVQFGDGYSNAAVPDDVEGYVYISCMEVHQPTVWNVQFPGQITMMRVPLASIETKSAYQWYSGSGPTWSSDKASRVPIWQDTPNGIMRISETYITGVGRYVLIGQQRNKTTALDAHIGIYESEHPWGPWKTVLYDNAQHSGIMELAASKTVFWGLSTKWSQGNDFVMVGTLPGEDEWGSIEGTFAVNAAPSEITTGVYNIISQDGLKVWKAN